jgi:low temperature requirement protein LtrA
MIGLTVGMGIWWNYFDMLGRRVPGQPGPRLANRLYAHLPLAMAIAAAGTATVSIIGHAEDSSTPAPSAWLLTGSVAMVLAAVSIVCSALPADELTPGMRRWIAPVPAVASGVPIAVAAFGPAPIVLVACTSAVLLGAWLVLFAVFLDHGGDPEVTGFRLGHDATSHRSGVT